MCASTASSVPTGDADPYGRSDATAGAITRRWWLVGTLVATVIALDQATKAWAVSALADHPRSIVGTDVELRLSRNTGSAFSLFRGFTPLLAVLAIVIAVLIVRSVRRAEDRLALVALALVLAGALGNLGDRLFRPPGVLRGAVVDFVKVESWPTFNVADSAITIGAVLLVIGALFARPEADRAAR
jgi:signal peptidase II